MTQNRSLIVAFTVLLLLGALNADGQLVNRLGMTDQIVIVAKSGRGFRSIQAALDSITDASEDNPYLVYVAPGVYAGRVVMKHFVDIEGAGEHLTRIVSAGPRTLKGADAALRSLTVECTGIDSCTAIDNRAALKITHVTIKASGRWATGIGTCCGDLTLKDVTVAVVPTPESGLCRGNGILGRCMLGCTPVLLFDDLSMLVANDECTNTGVYLRDDFEMTNSSIVVEGEPASISVFAGGSSAVLKHVTVAGDSWAVGSYGALKIKHSEISGAIATGLGEDVAISHSELTDHVSGDSVSCFSTCGPKMSALDEHCQPILE